MAVEGSTVIDFSPDGYLATAKAMAVAARRWFPERFAALEKTATSQQGAELENPIEKAVRIFSQPPIPDDWRQAFEEIKNETFCTKVSCTAIISTTTGTTRHHASSGPRPMPMASWRRVSTGRSAGQAGYTSNGQTIRCFCGNRNWTRC